MVGYTVSSESYEASLQRLDQKVLSVLYGRDSKMKQLPVLCRVDSIMKQLHICISGFLQDRDGDRTNGILGLRNMLRDAHKESGNAFKVWYRPWTTDWKVCAADIARSWKHYEIIISGYSYGGYGAVKLCKYLKKLGIKVHQLNLCDPVGRWQWWPRGWPALRSLLSREYAIPHYIPPNVISLTEVYQTNNRPQGHKLKVTKHTKIISSVKMPDLTHDQMDNSSFFHILVYKSSIRTIN